MHIIGKIDIEIYRCVTADIQTSDVIITQQQIEHIQERHPNDYEWYFKYVNEILESPDYILEANKPKTAFILKHICDNGKNYQLILRLNAFSRNKGINGTALAITNLLLCVEVYKVGWFTHEK